MRDVRTDQGPKAKPELMERCLFAVLGHRWLERISNPRLLRLAGVRHVACSIRERQLWLCSHVARLPQAEPVRQAGGGRGSFLMPAGCSRWMVTVGGLGWIGYLRG